MDAEKFRQLVERLEAQSELAPRLYRTKVVALVLLGFCILGALLGAMGFGLLLILGLAAVLAWSGGAALALLLNAGKLLILLVVPLWFGVVNGTKALLVRLPVPQGREVSSADAPPLFEALRDMRRRMRGPRVHRVLLVDDVNAAVVQRPAFGLAGWPRNHLLLGLPLLEALSPEEAMAVVAHEYGHLAGSHGRFSAFVYRLRHTWATIQDYAEHVQGWLAKLIVPTVRWYAPYFNAYTFVMARHDEYRADAASAELVGATIAVRALKRVGLVTQAHRRFLQHTFDRVAHESAPPGDLAERWAKWAADPTADVDARQWLSEAMDQEPGVTDTHPPLRARVAALADDSDAAAELPPPLPPGGSAAQAWFGERLALVRAELQSNWADRVRPAWRQRHHETWQLRGRLAELSALAERDVAQEIERIRLLMQLEPDTDARPTLAEFNAAHPDHPLGLFLEGAACLDKDEHEGLALLERAVELDPEATKAACERAHAYLMRRGDRAAAQPYAERWQRRDEFETLRARQLEKIEPSSELASHGLDNSVVESIRRRLGQDARRHVRRIFLARRVIPIDPSAGQWLLGVELTWWGRFRGRQKEVLGRLTALEWPLPLVMVTLDGRFAGMRSKFRGIPDAHVV
jgi:Zn-dependent protease with chaperone function